MNYEMEYEIHNNNGYLHTKAYTHTHTHLIYTQSVSQSVQNVFLVCVFF